MFLLKACRPSHHFKGMLGLCWATALGESVPIAWPLRHWGHFNLRGCVGPVSLYVVPMLGHRCTCQATFNSLLCIGKFEQMFGGELYILVSDIGTIRKPPPSHQYHFVGSCLRLSGRHIHAQTVSPTHTHIVAKFSTYLFTPLGQKTGLRVQPCLGWKVSSFFILT